MPEAADRPSSRLRLVILDMDGVLYRGDTPIPGAADLARNLHQRGLLVRYATNNSMFTRAAYALQLGTMGIDAAPEEIVTSTSATIDHLRRHEQEVRIVLAVGADGMASELRSAGYDVLPAAVAAAGEEDHAAPDAVVVGLDLQFDDARLAAAAGAVRQGARFIATNADARYPTPTGFRPGAGAMVAAIAEASGSEPLIIGKPAPGMFASILEEARMTAGEALVVGDNPDSDIAGAHRSGIESVLVLTGVTDADAAADLEDERRPDHVVADPAAAWALITKRLEG